MNQKGLYINYSKLKDWAFAGGMTLVMFSYIYSIQFKHLPVSCNIILGLLGIMWFFSKIFNKYNTDNRMLKRSDLGICAAIFSVLAVYMVATAVNHSSDLSFFRTMILTGITFCGAYFIGEILKRREGALTFERVVFYITLAALLQMLLTILLFLKPDSVSFLQSFLRFSNITAETMSRLEGARMMGFGTSFFSSGYIHAFVLIAIGAVIREGNISQRRQFFYLAAFVIIGAISTVSARTTLAGFGLGGLLLLMPVLRTGKKNLVILLSIITVGVVIVIIRLPSEILSLILGLLNYGFELFINYFVNHEVRTNSTDIMFTMYVFPDNLKTWLIGDGYFIEPTETEMGYYYMGTDIGWCRMLFLFGGIGTLVFTLYEFYIMRIITLKGFVPKAYAIMVCILFMVVNLKGFADLAAFAMLFYYCNSKSQVQQLQE